MAQDDLVLLVGHGAGELAALLPTGLVGRVLVHDGEVAVVAADIPHAVEDRARVVHVAGKHQVAHDDARPHGAVVGEVAGAARANGLDHGGQRLGGDVGIVAGAGQRRGKVCRGVLEVGEPHVDHVGHPAHDVRALVAGGVADDGQVEPGVTCHEYRLADLWGKVKGRDQVDVESALVAQLEHHHG